MARRRKSASPSTDDENEVALEQDKQQQLEDDPQEQALLEQAEEEDAVSAESDDPSRASAQASSDYEESDDDDDEQAGSSSKREIARKEKARLKQLQEKKKNQLDKYLKEQNSLVDADMETKAQGRMKFLLEQTEIFGHFARGAVKAKKTSGRGRHAFKLTEEEEDAACLKEEECALGDDTSGTGGTRLVTQPACIVKEMRDYQLAGLNWLIRLYENGINGILADEMGLGKTLQTISMMAYLHEFRGISGPHMVVAPKSTLGNWINEIKKFCPVLRAFKFHGNQEERAYQREHQLVAKKFDVCVTSFEMAIKEKAALKKFNWCYIIIDEAHRLKNENSLFAKTMRMFASSYRLLITGTPLQNNLHELWALLNFLLPEVFSSAETFDDWFQISEEKDQQEVVVKQLHKVLRPFLLRRLKSDVEKGLPPKKETILKVGMSQMQRKCYRSLLQKDIEAFNSGGERRRLLNVAMQLRKCCNHPYLFDGAETQDPNAMLLGEHLVENSGKMVLLDKLLVKLKQRDSRVLIFSQMTRLLDILEDYCTYRSYSYCRIDGSTSGEDREAAIESFNREGSEKFIFLLSTRAGGLGINLATADIVILYDSDWNPQVDLQAQDRAHRIGQKKEVQVFRFCTQYTIEEKVIERAYKKLALDALVIQQGRLSEQKGVNKDDLLKMVRFGAEKVFSSNDSTITDEDIDRIIARGEEATAELDAKMKKFTDDAIKFKMDDTAEFYDFEDNKEEEKVDLRKLVVDNWTEPSKRERKKSNYSETEYFKQAMRTGGGSSKPKEPRARIPQLHDFQFFNLERLKEINHKEEKFLLTKDNGDIDAGAEPLTPEEQEEKERLLGEGFASWTRRDFYAFVRGCEKYGRSDAAGIATEVEGKTVEEVERYCNVFQERYKELNDYERTLRNIEKGEARMSRKDEIMRAIGRKMDKYKNPWQDMKIHYGQNKGKLYNEECDRFLVCMTHRKGYGNWEHVKTAISISPMFKFDWFFKSRTPAELSRRCDTLIRMIERESQDVEKRAKKQKNANNGSTSDGEEDQAPSRKRKNSVDASYLNHPKRAR